MAFQLPRDNLLSLPAGFGKDLLRVPSMPLGPLPRSLSPPADEQDFAAGEARALIEATRSALEAGARKPLALPLPLPHLALPPPLPIPQQAQLSPFALKQLREHSARTAAGTGASAAAPGATQTPPAFAPVPLILPTFAVAAASPSAGRFRPCHESRCSTSGAASCHAAFLKKLQGYGLTATMEEARLGFHVQEAVAGSPSYAEATQAFTDKFALMAVMEVDNPILRAQYELRKEAIGFAAGSANEKIVYHVTKANLLGVCNEGLDPRYAQRGFFGKGIYLTDSPAKANDYSPEKGNAEAVRVVLQCRVLLGRSKEFELGHFDRDLVVEPKGFHSVQGFIRRNAEFVVYNRDQVYVERVIFYRYLDTANELAPCLQVPPNITGHVVYITAALSEFFSRLQQRAGPVGSTDFLAVKRLTAALLKNALTVDEFLAEVGKVLKAAPPTELAAKIQLELGRCKLGAAADAAKAEAAARALPTLPTLQTPSPLPTPPPVDDSRAKRPHLDGPLPLP